MKVGMRECLVNTGDTIESQEIVRTIVQLSSSICSNWNNGNDYNELPALED